MFLNDIGKCSKEYKKRIIDGLLDINMQAFGATWIKGPKGCGKTTSAKQKAKSLLSFRMKNIATIY